MKKGGTERLCILPSMVGQWLACNLGLGQTERIWVQVWFQYEREFY
jgi:hypothetical protein